MGLILSFNKKREEFIEIRISESEIIRIKPYYKKGSIKLNIDCIKKYNISLKELIDGEIKESRKKIN